MPVRRSSDMQLVAYALARCGAPNPKGGASLPPVWLGVSGWGQAYDLFHEALADGRPGKSFANSLKNARDAFDAHVPSGRVGWVDHSNGVPYRQDTMVGTILAQWGPQSDEELCNAVLAILDGAPSGSGPEESVRTEGGQRVYLVRHHERDPALRAEAVRLHGARCMGCGFDFEAAYGEHGKGYIEVHHSMPLAEHGVRTTDPARDLVCLCANCHRMVHRRRAVCLSLDELRAKLAKPSA